MLKQLQRALSLLALLAVQAAPADIVLLVHGYASNAQTWELSGINSELQFRGWPRAGVLTAATGFMPAAVPEPPNKSYTADLPADAPLLVQADYLRGVLTALRQRYPDEKLILVGHSAGGVVGRLALMGGNPFRVGSLITIAAPHLGTVRAAQGLDIVDSKPFFCPGPGIDFLKTVVGGRQYEYLKYSRGALIDLLPMESGNILGWLNQQPHPDIGYYAVVRRTAFMLGDEVVPAYSQDLNNVPSLRGRAKVLYTPTGHSLQPEDGVLLAGILSGS